jgi:site-specific recombinase XerD
MSGSVIGKGDKLEEITFNEIAREKLVEYLKIRNNLLVEKNCPYVFVWIGGK